MKKTVTLLLMVLMLFSFSVTVNAADSPSGKTETSQGTTLVTSPKTGESDRMLYGLGTAAVALASGAIIIRKKGMTA